MPNLADLRESRNKLMADASTLSKGEMTAETRSKFDAMIAGVDAADADIKRLEAVETFESEQRSRNVNRPQPGAVDAEQRSAEVRNSLRNYMSTGQVETRDLTVAANGGVMVPTLFDPTLRSAQRSFGELYDIVTVMKTEHGNPIKIAFDDDTHGLIPVTVGTDVSEVDPAMTGKTLQVDNYSTGLVRVDMGLLGDSSFDIEQWLRDVFAKRFYRGVSSLIANGNSSAVESITGAYASNTIQTATTGKVGYGDIVAAIAGLDPAYSANASFAMSTAGLASVLSITTTTGSPIFLPNTDVNTGWAGSLLGRPVKIVTQLPTVATGNTAILYGDFKAGYTFRQQGDMGILRLNERYAAAYEVGFVGFCRIGGISTDAGSHPILGISIK